MTTGKGGGTRIFDKSPTPEDRQDPEFRESGWRFSEKVVDGIVPVRIPAVTGSLVFLPTLKFHSIEPSVANGKHRISFSAFIVKKSGDETLYLYS